MFDPEDADLASLRTRVGAHFVDAAVIVCLVLPAIIAAQVSEPLAEKFLIAGGLAVLVYVFLLEGLWNGRTVGKAVGGVRVVDMDGEPIGVGKSIVRNIVGVLGGIAGILGPIVGAVLIAESDLNQRAGDRIAGTVVVED